MNKGWSIISKQCTHSKIWRLKVWDMRPRWNIFLLKVFVVLFCNWQDSPAAYLGLLTEKWAAVPTRGEPAPPLSTSYEDKFPVQRKSIARFSNQHFILYKCGQVAQLRMAKSLQPKPFCFKADSKIILFNVLWGHISRPEEKFCQMNIFPFNNLDDVQNVHERKSTTLNHNILQWSRNFPRNSSFWGALCYQFSEWVIYPQIQKLKCSTNWI